MTRFDNVHMDKQSSWSENRSHYVLDGPGSGYRMNVCRVSFRRRCAYSNHYALRVR